MLAVWCGDAPDGICVMDGREVWTGGGGQAAWRPGGAVEVAAARPQPVQAVGVVRGHICSFYYFQDPLYCR